MLDFENGTFVELDLGLTPSASGGGLCLLQQEEVHDAFLLLSGYTPRSDTSDRRDAIALVTVVGVSQSVFGYPNEEAFWFDSRGSLDHGFYELQGSGWKSNVLEYNRRTYGSHHNTWSMGGKFDQARHYFVGSKDVSAQFLAQSLRVETFLDQPYRAVLAIAAARLADWFNWAQTEARPIDPGADLVRSHPAELD